MKRFMALTAVVALSLVTLGAQAQKPSDSKMSGGKMGDSKMSGGKMSGGKMDSGKMASGKKDNRASNVYACKTCKTYYPAADARKMHYKDSMGHKLAHMDKAPVGYKDGSKMASNKMDDKMKGGKM